MLRTDEINGFCYRKENKTKILLLNNLDKVSTSIFNDIEAIVLSVVVFV